MSSKLLMIHQGALGDVIQTFPSVRYLRKNFSAIDAWCQNQIGHMARELRVVDACFPIETLSFSSLFSDNPNAAVKTMFNACSAIVLFSFSAALEQTIRAVSPCPVYRIAPRPDGRQRIHVAEYLLRQLIDFNLIAPPYPPQASVLSGVIHEDRRDPFYDPKRILLHPGSGSRKKNWPVQNFLEMEHRSKAAGFTPEYVLGPAERSLAEALQKEKDPATCVHGVESLTELVALLKTSGGFIGNDSGVTHLAAFLGLPTVAVFGPSDPRRWRPLGRAVRVIDADPDCGPCFELDDRDCNDTACLKEITVDRVMNGFLDAASSGNIRTARRI